MYLSNVELSNPKMTTSATLDLGKNCSHNNVGLSKPKMTTSAILDLGKNCSHSGHKKKRNLCYVDFTHCFIKKIKIHSLVVFFYTL